MTNRKMREKMFSKFTDAELASVGMTREEVLSGDLSTLTKKVENEAFAQFDEEEEGIEAVVDMALEKIQDYPDHRMEAFAALWGQCQLDVGNLPKDADRMFLLFMFAVFKLAETYLGWETERASGGVVTDGNIRGVSKS